MNRTSSEKQPFDLAVEGRAVAIAMLNDQFRETVLFQPTITGRAVITPGVSALDSEERKRLFQAVATFTGFDEGNDPNGEHDFFATEQDGVRYFAKIDYFDDRSMKYGSEDAGDPSKCYRVLTILRADEY